jgi:DNA-binding transcriptional MerR regulator
VVIITVFTVTVDHGTVKDVTTIELTVDEVARQAGLPVRTVREYQTMGLLDPPAKRGRVGVYRSGHLARLRLIARLQARGYSLAGIRDLVDSWSGGADLGEVLGVGPDELVHIDEPGTPATLDQLAASIPELVPDRLDELLAVGVVDDCGEDRYCVPSPSLLHLARGALAAGYEADRVLALLAAIGRAADDVAGAVVAALAQPPTPAAPDRAALDALAVRGRGLLAHGTGRLMIHALGRRLGITDEATAPDLVRSLLRGTTT